MNFLLQDSKSDKGIDDAIIIFKSLVASTNFPSDGKERADKLDIRMVLGNRIAHYWTSSLFIFFTH